MLVARTRVWQLASALLVAACSSPPQSNQADAAPDLLPKGYCSGTSGCPSGQFCYQMMCLPDRGTCQTDNDCEGDSYCDCTKDVDAGTCMGGVCIPYGKGPRGLFSPECASPSFTWQEVKSPVIKCSWTSAGIVSSPVVIDLDRDGQPEILFTTFPDGNLVALKGTDCSPMWSKSAGLNAYAQLAAGDLDGDLFPEIVGLANGKLVVFDRTGAPLATSALAYQGGPSSGNDCSGPAIADLDGQAPPEIVVGGQVARYNKGQGLSTVYSNSASPAGPGTMSIAADLNGDGVAELIAGRAIYDGKTGADRTPAEWEKLNPAGFYPAVADFTKDSKPDLVMVQPQNGKVTVSIWDWTNKKYLFGPVELSGSGGGPPTLADYDGDGALDVGMANTKSFTVLSTKCWPNGGGKCSAPGILWQRETKGGQNGTSSAAFDFNGDGKAEVVLRDQCFLRLLGGDSGKTVAIRDLTSRTCMEEPAVADLNGDGHAEVIVTSSKLVGDECLGLQDVTSGRMWAGETQGLFVLADPRWMDARPIWNQHSYHMTNINGNSSVPTQEGVLASGGYRRNGQGRNLAGPLADLTAGSATGAGGGGGDCVSAWSLRADLCNRGSNTVETGLPGTFYTADPHLVSAEKICTAKTTGALSPGQCETVTCDWLNPPKGTKDLYFRANDDGSGNRPESECWQRNNLLPMPNATCKNI